MASVENSITEAEGANVDDIALRIAFRGAVHSAILKAATFEALRSLLAGLFGAAAMAGAKIRYLDEDEDRVLICTTDELQEAIEYASELGAPLQIDVEAPAATKVAGPEPSSIEKSTEDVDAKAVDSSSPESPKDRKQEDQNERQPHRGSGLDELLKDPGFVSTLADALQLAADMLIAGESSPATVLDSVLATYPSLGRQPRLARGLPFARAVAAMLPKEVVGPALLEAVLEAQASLTSGDSISPKDLMRQFKAIGMRHMRDVMGSGRGAGAGGRGGFDPMQALNMISMFSGLANGGGPPGGFGGGGFNGPSSWSPDEGFRPTESAGKDAKGNPHQQGDAKKMSSPKSPTGSGYRLGGDSKSSRLFGETEHKSGSAVDKGGAYDGQGTADPQLAKALALSMQDHQQVDSKNPANAPAAANDMTKSKLLDTGDKKMLKAPNEPIADDADRDLQAALAMSLQTESKTS